VPRIFHITNFPPREVFDGGTCREEALAAFLASRGAKRLIVQDDTFYDSKVDRLRRLFRLIRAIEQEKPELVVCNYPSYPFYWEHRVTPYFILSVVFAYWARHATRKIGCLLVLDIMDLPVFQYADLGYEIKMRPATLKRFDKYLFHRADRLWVCSESLSRLIHQEYGVSIDKITTVLNGHNMEFKVPVVDLSGPLKLAYAGSLNPCRGIATMIDAFLASDLPDAELHLCGAFGEWIGERYCDNRLIYHGGLADAQAAVVLKECQVGVIPYPESGYYNLAFATKLPFYMALGQPVLCSEARETASHVSRLGIGLVCPLSQFAAGIRYLDSHRDQIAAWRQRITEVRNDFSWSNLYAKALEETLSKS
jgi:glycosyltransferase involved in cell wall biosynthesis